MREKTPTVILGDKTETLAWLAQNNESFPDKYSVRSDWLCDELDRFEKDGYVYNAQAFDRLCSENGLTSEMAERRVPGQNIRTENGLLGSLIYNAQAYRRVRQLQRDGWTRAAQDTLAPFEGKKCQAICNGSLSGKIVAIVKRFNDRLRLCPPRTRTKAYAEYEDWWIKAVPVAVQS